MILVQHEVVPQEESPVVAVKMIRPVVEYMLDAAVRQKSYNHAGVDFRGED